MSKPGPDESYKAQVQQAPQFQQICRKRKAKDEAPAIQTAPTQLPPTSSDIICAKCSDLGHVLLQILQKELSSPGRDIKKYLDGVHVADVGFDYRHRQGEDCVLCSMLCSSRVVTPRGKTVRNHGDEMRLEKYTYCSGLVIPAIYHRSPRLIKNSSTFLAIGPKGVSWKDYQRLQNSVRNQGAAVLLRDLDGEQPAMFAPQEVPACFNADRASGWLQYCKNNHNLLCGRSKQSRVTTGLRLIDCTDRTVITAAQNNNTYVALSYVWGSSSDIDSRVRYIDNRCLLPQKLSSVISDAISVAQALGFQYLWVDKFCIDQDNAAAKHDQIGQMNHIYANAELTIVAAAGADETYGLPGVGKRARTHQNTVKLGDWRIISTMQDPHLTIERSRWASRGWTFQEGVLSRRRLVFTDEQMYFECNAMNCWESIYYPLDEMHLEDKSRFSDIRRGGIFGRNRYDNFGKMVPDEMTFLQVFGQYISAIRDYSSKELSYDTDSLNAFRGIIQRYSKHKHPINAIWGVPYVAQVGQEEERDSYFAGTLAWSHAQSGRGSANQPRRREAFPSWTWAGWAGTVQTNGMEYRWDLKVYKNALESVRFGRHDDATDLNSLTLTTLESECRVLHLLARALPPSLFVCKTATKGKMSWTFGECQAELVSSRDRLLEAQLAREMGHMGRWRCIWICSKSIDSYAMVLELNHKTDNWTRAGLFEVQCRHVKMKELLKDIDAAWFSIE